MVGIADDPPERDDANADIDVPEGRRSAMIRFASTWAERPPEELRQTVVHELLHCHTEGVFTPINAISYQVGQLIHGPLYQAVLTAVELATDGIACEWAKTLPLPIAEPVEAGGEIEEAA